MGRELLSYPRVWILILGRQLIFPDRLTNVLIARLSVKKSLPVNRRLLKALLLSKKKDSHAAGV